VSACLKRRGVTPVILERAGQVGSSWRNHYERLHLHTVKRFSSLPGMPWPEDVAMYPSRQDVVDYLDAYARRFGLAGKTCIHPSQIALANQAFRPTDAEIRHAAQVLEAAKRHEAGGTGAYMVDGHMVDLPFVRRAQDVVALARRLNIHPSD
jgi:hypothetical protein